MVTARKSKNAEIIKDEVNSVSEVEQVNMEVNAVPELNNNNGAKNKYYTFSELYSIDLGDQLKTDHSKLSYLSWATAYKIVMEIDPNFTFEVLPLQEFSYKPGETTVMVWVKGTFQGVTKTMWLPVMNSNRMKNATVNPSAREISDTIMRCLVKLIALYGIGLYVYNGEDIPDDASIQNKIEESKKYVTNKQADELKKLRVELGLSTDDARRIASSYCATSFNLIPADKYQEVIERMKSLSSMQD